MSGCLKQDGSPKAGLHKNSKCAYDPRIETVYDVLSAIAVAKAPPILPVPITTIVFTLLLLGLVALRDQETTTIFR